MPTNDKYDNITKSDTISNPPNNADEFYRNSLVGVLQKAVGYYVICEFLIGTGGIESKEGILHAVGFNFLTLKFPDEERYTVCDLYSLKFVTVFDTKTRPRSLMNQGNRYNNIRQR